MKHLALPSLLATALLLGGCISMAPDYRQPEAPVATQWRDAPAAQVATADAATANTPVAETPWQDFFQDERLRRVIALALENNRDLRIAMLHIEKARAQYRIQRADLFPAITAGGSQSASRTPSSVSSSTSTSSSSSSASAVVSRQHSADVGFSSYELDLFGRIRSLTDEALQTFLATAETQRSTRLSLVAEVAGDWLTLAADRQRLALARQTLESQRESLRLTEHLHAQGTASGLDLAQIQSSVESARADVASYAAQVQQDRNALELIVGAAVPEEMLPPEEALKASVLLAQIPADMSSSVLLQRPDVLSAERSLKAANADIGAARAAFFPTISLTASTGFSSSQLAGLFGSGNRSWSFAPSISVPIFNAGSLRASLKVSEVERDVAVATYEKTIQTAFKETADALAVRATLQERLDAQQALVEATARSYRLSTARYRSGVDSYLDALDSQRSLYTAQQNLISLRLTESSNRVTLYKVLGGLADGRS
ncbi:efflux transporter, NodT family [Variovorax paradoxus B4]|uniref:Efflux transporter, NodT family n=1 Tax=Variovorax paradoxus B4 TaxID=1246301 RepID=T1XMD2_VARPD|nr:efflux transporter outer membrane subunit [Variovorax paradoxus]AGU53280.1 efflux transporter, NodT family [Variovorax paradoxus B4]